MSQKPSVGRVVHYVLPEDSCWPGEHRAATISQDRGGYQNLSVHKGQSNDFRRRQSPAGPVSGCISGDDQSHGVALVGSVAQDQETKKPGTWHWPERED